MEELKCQEIFVRIKFSPELKVNKRTFAWRALNFNKFWIKDVSLDQEKGEASFTSEFNMNFSKSQIEDVIKNSSFTTGQGITVKFIEFELVELKEESEIYDLN